MSANASVCTNNGVTTDFAVFNRCNSAFQNDCNGFPASSTLALCDNDQVVTYSWLAEKGVDYYIHIRADDVTNFTLTVTGISVRDDGPCQSEVPSDAPSLVPSLSPSSLPNDAPSLLPSSSPSSLPTDTPSLLPSTQQPVPAVTNGDANAGAAVRAVTNDGNKSPLSWLTTGAIISSTTGILLGVIDIQ